MAEPTKVKIYNFGDRKLDYGKYITNLENNVESYLQNQKDTEGWDDNRIQEFRNSFGEILSNFRNDYQGGGTRFSTNQLGAIVDTQGILTDTDSDDFFYNKKGEQIDRTKYDALKDRKKRRYSAFEANREVAEYFRRIGSYMKDYEDTTEKFDLSKHGFNKWLMDREAPGGTFNYQNYWDLDPVDTKTGKRGTKQRVAQAKKWIDDYITEMKGRNDLNFEGNKSFTSLEDYLKKAQNVADQWGNPTWDASDRIAAQRLGIDNDFMTKFFGTEGTPDSTPQENAEVAAQREYQQQVETEQKTQEQLEKDYNNWVEQQGLAYYNSGYKSAPFAMVMPDIHKYYDFDNDDLFKATADKPYTDYDNLISKFKGNIDNSVKNYIRRMYDPSFNPSSFTTNQHYAFLPWALRNYGVRLEDGRYYIPVDRESPDYKRNSALLFNPKTRQFQYVFIGDVPGQEEWTRRRAAYRQSQQQKQSGYKYTAYREEGGVLKYQNGRTISYDEYKKQQDELRAGFTKDKAEAAGKTVEQQQALDEKRPLRDHFTDVEWARILGAGADIASAITAFTANPIASGVTGVVGTGFNTYADINDKSLSNWDRVKNTGINLGFDALGMIPYFGSTASGWKVAKNLAHVATKIAAVFGTYQGIKNSPQIAKSFTKLASDPSNLTVEDWQNMAQGIGVLTGVVGGTRREYVQQTKTNPPPKETNYSALRFVSKNGGGKYTRVFGGQTATDLRNAKDNDAIRAILNRDAPHLLENYNLDVKNTTNVQIPYKPKEGFRPMFQAGEKQVKVLPVYQEASGKYYTTRKFSETFGKSRGDIKEMRLALPTEAEMGKLNHDRVRRILDNDLEFKNAKTQADQALLDVQNKQQNLDWYNKQKTEALENQKGFREKYKNTSDIEENLASAKARQSTTEYQDIVKQQSVLDQKHADLVARHQPVMNAYKQKLQEIDNQIALYTEKSLNATKKSEKNTYEKVLKKLNEDRVDIQNRHDNLAKEIQTAETEAKNNKAQVDVASAERIQELSDALTKSKQYDTKLADIDKQLKYFESLGGDHTPAYLELWNKRVNKDGKITFTDEHGRKFTTDAIRAMRLAGIKKNGGILDAVEKFQNSGKIKSPMRDVQNPGNVSWYQDMFVNGLNATKIGEDGIALPNWFDKWKIDDPVYNPDKFNQLQADWYHNLKVTGYTEGSNKAVRNPGVEKRQPDWEATGGNAPIAEMLKPGPNGEAPRLVGNGGTEDKPDENGKFGTDGVFGQQEFLRHGGTWEDWEKRPNELAEFNNKLAERGLVYERDRSRDTDMMMLYPLDKQPEKPTEPEKPAAKATYVNLPVGKKEKEEKPRSNKFDNLYAKAKQLFGDPDLIANTRLFNTLSQIDRERDLDKKKLPYLKEVPSPHLYVRKDFMALQNARKAQGMLMHMASQPITPDGNQQLSYYADQFTKMLDYGLQGNQLADAKFWETTDASKANEIENLKARVANRNDNMATLIEKQHNDITSEEVADYKKTTAINNRLYELQARNEQKRLDQEDAQRRADAMLLDNDITYNLSKYAKQFGISDEEVNIWNKVQAGTAPSKLSKEELPLWESVYRKVNYGRGLLTAQQSGAVISNFGNVREIASNSTKPSSPTAYNPNTPSWGKFKEGGKVAAKSRIKVAKIRERIKNADRAARAAEKNLDRVQRTVESINKRMYGVKR